MVVACLVVTRARRMKTMGGRMQQARIDAGLTQQHLANKVGCTKLTILKIENGESNPGLNLFVAICATLGVRIDEIVYGGR